MLPDIRRFALSIGHDSTAFSTRASALRNALQRLRGGDESIRIRSIVAVPSCRCNLI
jgi:hypothetical protein